MKFKLFSLIAVILLTCCKMDLMAQIPPTLVYPQNFDSCQSRFLTLEWQAVPNAISYRLEVSDTSNFQNIVINQANLTLTQLNIVLNDWQQRYFWRVYSVFPGGTEGKSEAWIFKTKKAPVVLVSVPNEINCVDTNARFVWKKADAEFYTLQIATDSLFTDFIYNKNNLTDTSVAVSIPFYNTKFYWRVAAKKGLCLTDWSERWEFTSKQHSPQLLLPANGAKGAELFNSVPFITTLKWAATENATIYDIQVSDSPNFTTFFTQASIPDTSYDLNLASNYDSLFYWRVRSTVNGCVSYWSEPFKLRTPYIQSTPTLPLDNELCVSMGNNLIKWTVIPGATKYSIDFTTDSNFVNNIIQVKDINEIQTSIVLDKALTMYYWRVRGEDSKNIGLWSSIYKFQTTQRPPSSFIPADSSYGSQKALTLSWENFGANTYYDLKVASDIEMKHLLVDTTLLDTNYFDLTVPTNNTTYYWSARVRTGACLGDWSKIVQFKTLINSPELILPAQGAVVEVLYPIFEWNTVDDATGYEIEVSLDSNFTSLYKYDNFLVQNTMSFAGAPFQEKTTYYWRVRAKNNEGKSLWSQFSFFTIQEQAVGAPNKLVPFNSQVSLPFEFTFIWNSQASALSYDFELASDNQFTNMVASANIIGSDTSYAITGLAPFTYYYWRVRTINKGGAGNWGITFKFRTKDIKPSDIVQLVAPEDDAKNMPISLEFVWDSIPRAKTYDIFIATDTNFTEASTVYSFEKVYNLYKKVNDLSYNTEYFWRVRGFNEAGYSPYSLVRSFKTIDPTSVEDNDPLFVNINIRPNPVSSNASINFDLKQGENVKLQIHSLLGKEVYSVAPKYYSNGNHIITFNADTFHPGLYIYTLIVGNKSYNGTFVVK